MSPRSVGIALVLSASMMLAGCIPATFHYFAPQANTGTLVYTRGECNNVKDAIEFRDPDLDWVRIRVHADVTGKDSAGLTFWIAKQPSYDFGIFSSDKDRDEGLKRIEEMMHQPIPVAFGDDHISVTTSAGARTELPLALPGGEKKTFTLVDRTDYEQHFRDIAAPGEYFDLDIPPIAFNGTRLVIPRIRMIRTSEMVMQGINC